MAALPSLQHCWRIVPGDEGWTFEAFEFPPPPPAEPPSADDPSRLPSMADLLLQASPAIFCDVSGGASVKDAVDEGGGGQMFRTGGGGQMFRTGSGKPVAVMESSISRAIAVLGQGGMLAAEGQASCSASYADSSFSCSLFQSGSGKTIKLSSKSLSRASNLLSDNKENFSHSQKCEPILNHVCDIGQHTWDGGGNLVDKYLVNAGEETTCNTKPLITVSGHKRQLTGPTCMYLSEKQSDADVCTKTMGCGMKNFAPKEPQIKIQTAGGRSLSVSGDALKRAMNLLGGSEFGIQSCNMNSGDSLCFSSSEKRDFNMTSCSKENIPLIPIFKPKCAINEGLTEKMQPCFGTPTQSNPFRPASNLNSTGGIRERIGASDDICKHTERERAPLLGDTSYSKELPINSPMQDKLQGVDGSPGKQQNSPFVDILNDNHGESTVPPFGLLSAYSCKPSPNGGKRRLGRRSSISPFKQPRQSRFFAPLLNGFPCKDAQIQSVLSCADAKATKSSISSHYPFQQKRKSLLEFFQLPPHHCSLAENLPDKVKHMSAETAARFTFSAESASLQVGSEVLWKMLIESGASPMSCSKEWTANHYKWIVWKLAALERCYPAQVGRTLLTVANILEELKYSPYKKLETLDKPKDKPSSSTSIDDLANPVKHEVAKIELTDGWYSVNAVLDVPLSRQLALGKLFIGQKLRVCGASLCGWVAPVGPLEAGGNVALSLHINGTFRTHWAERLGFCKGYRNPLSFRCINVNGGAVLRTLVGVTRLYPLLYKERLQQGGSVIRSERTESKMLQIYKQRCSMVAEGIMSELYGENFGSSDVAEDESEGAKIFKLLETAAEPDILMETLTEQQLVAYKNYQSKQEERRNSEIKKRVEMALDGAGLRSREVTPFLRVQVVGMTPRNSNITRPCRRGLITIWEPTEKQLLDLEEGQVYSVTGLVPVSLNNDVLQLQTRGSRTKWECLQQSARGNFEPFFSPRKSISLSNIGEVPISSEFDIAGVIVYVGELYLSGNHKKQWVFLTDGSILDCINSPNSLLAISFSLSITDAESCAPLHSALTGSTVVFCNLIKRVRDQADQLWVAEATEYSTYSFSCSSPGLSHLKEAADSVSKWSRMSSVEIEKLRERVLGIIGF
ncbi:protein BREAST CANCER SUSCEPTIBILITY 2 homolog A-like isoform X2 [Nymphaea colorata]|nr:protein BREAST CANCER SUSCEPTIBILITY 2 homolog A-like isoform X2 [Nymphaea colorata]